MNSEFYKDAFQGRRGKRDSEKPRVQEGPVAEQKIAAPDEPEDDFTTEGVLENNFELESDLEGSAARSRGRENSLWTGILPYI